MFKKTLTALSLLAIIHGFNSAQAAIDANFSQTFSNPTVDNRPLTRWWIPGANMTKAEIRREIESMAAAGFGGAEVVPVSMDGGDGNGKIEWGTDNWKDLTNYMLEVAGELNFTIDFTMTPAWPLALPTIQNVNDPNQGGQMELDGAWIDGISKQHPFKGKLPKSKEAVQDSKKVHGKVELIGVTVAKYIDRDQKILDYDSARSFELNLPRLEVAGFLLLRSGFIGSFQIKLSRVSTGLTSRSSYGTKSFKAIPFLVQICLLILHNPILRR